MTDQFRAMCAELAEEVEHLWSIVRDDNNEPHSLANRARALLAQQVAEEPTDEELLRLAREWNSGFESIELHFASELLRSEP